MTDILEIKEFYKNHSKKETEKKFGLHRNWLARHGLFSAWTQRRMNCPPKLTQEQHEILTGNLLGDGSIRYIKNVNQETRFAMCQKEGFSEYLEGLRTIYAPFADTPPYHGKSSKPINSWDGKRRVVTNTILTPATTVYYTGLHTIAHPIFTSYRMDWYEEPYGKRSRKVIPADLQLTWRTAAIWMCDDGSNDVKGRFLTLHTNSFKKNDVELLIAILSRDLGVEGRTVLVSPSQRSENNLLKIKIFGDHWEKFLSEIDHFIPWQCMRYKCVSRKKVDQHTVMSPGNVSGYAGVYPEPSNGGKQIYWRASYRDTPKGINLRKFFKTKEQAISQRLAWESQMALAS